MVGSTALTPKEHESLIKRPQYGCLFGNFLPKSNIASRLPPPAEQSLWEKGKLGCRVIYELSCHELIVSRRTVAWPSLHSTNVVAFIATTSICASTLYYQSSPAVNIYRLRRPFQTYLVHPILLNIPPEFFSLLPMYEHFVQGYCK